MGRSQILLENEISIFKKLVSRSKNEVLQNFLVNGCSDVGFQKTQWTKTSRWHCTPNHHRLWKLEWWWMMHLYSVLLCIAIPPKHFTITWGGGGVSPQPPPVCSIHLDDATAATGQQRHCAHHTPATGGEERESLSQSSGWGLLGGYEWWGPVVVFVQDTGVTPLLFTRSAMGFLMTTRVKTSV